VLSEALEVLQRYIAQHTSEHITKKWTARQRVQGNGEHQRGFDCSPFRAGNTDGPGPPLTYISADCECRPGTVPERASTATDRKFDLTGGSPTASNCDGKSARRVCLNPVLSIPVCGFALASNLAPSPGATGVLFVL